MSQIVSNFALATPCGPVKLQLSCEEDTSNFQIKVSPDGLPVNKNNITHLGLMNLCIDKPVFIGCHKLDFSNYLTDQTVWTLSVQDLDSEGTPTGLEVNFPVEVTVQQTQYKICFQLVPNPTPNEYISLKQSICDFENCKFILKFSDVKLTIDGGFPLCEIPKTTCSQVCGGLSLCATTPYPWDYEAPATSQAYYLGQQTGIDFLTIPDAQTHGCDLITFNGQLVDSVVVKDGSTPLTVPFTLKRDVTVTQITGPLTGVPGIILLGGLLTPAQLADPAFVPTGTVIHDPDFFVFGLDPSQPTFSAGPPAVFLPGTSWCYDICYTEIGPNGQECPDTSFTIRTNYFQLL
jgi:hypothetical protein